MTVEVRTGVCGRHYYHTMIFHTDDEVPTHEHAYDHETQVLVGEADIWEPDKWTHLNALDLYDVAAGVPHRIRGKAGSVVQCVHILRFDDGTIVPYGYKLTHIDVLNMTSAL